MFVWIAELSPPGCLHAHQVDDERAPVAALGDVARVAEALHELAQALPMRSGSQPVSVGLPENP